MTEAEETMFEVAGFRKVGTVERVGVWTQEKVLVVVSVPSFPNWWRGLVAVFSGNLEESTSTHPPNNGRIRFSFLANKETTILEPGDLIWTKPWTP